jgi:flagellar hook-associated protein 3 FlgL
MSGTVASVGTGYGFLNTLISNANTVHQQLNNLAEQVSSGLVSQTYAGLGSAATVPLDLNPQLATLQNYQTNITQASGTMQVTQAAMTQLQQIASTFAADMPDLANGTAQQITSIAAQAQSALQQVADLLNTQDAGVYVFAGQDTSNAPVPASNLAAFSTAVAAQVQSPLSSSSFANAIATASTTSPFSTYMAGTSIAQQVVQTGDGTTVPIGLLASQNSYATSTGTTATANSSVTSTGSYMQDLMCALATIGSITSTQTGDANFNTLVQNTTSCLDGAVSAMAGDVGALGNIQASLTQTGTQLSKTSTALSTQLSKVQDTDMATTLSNLSAIQTQLQASYRMISNEGTLSLVTYLPA